MCRTMITLPKEPRPTVLMSEKSSRQALRTGEGRGCAEAAEPEEPPAAEAEAEAEAAAAEEEEEEEEDAAAAAAGAEETATGMGWPPPMGGRWGEGGTLPLEDFCPMARKKMHEL